MKKLIFLILIIVVGKYSWDRYQKTLEEAKKPDVFVNPVYAVVRLEIKAQGRAFEEVIFAETRDVADCQNASKAIVGEATHSDQQGLSWQLKSSECKNELDDRHTKLFKNQPTSVTYLSLSRGSPKEREVRVVYWGVTVEESDRVCGGVSRMQQGRKGAVKCILAQR